MTPEQKAQEYAKKKWRPYGGDTSFCIENSEYDYLSGYIHAMKDLEGHTERDKEDGWIKLEDQLPPIYETVLLFDDWIAHDKSRTQEVRVGNLEYFTETTTSNGKTIDCHWFGTEFAFNITHWRPLPKFPKTK